MRIDTPNATFIERDYIVKNFETENGVPLLVIPGGKEPPQDGTGNWLMDMPVGMVFTVEDKSQPRAWTLGLFRLISKSGKTVELQLAGHPRTEYANPYRFVSQFNLWDQHGVVSDVTEQELKQEIEDDQRDRVEE